MSLRILVVEDDPCLRLVIADLLRQDGHDVIEADTDERGLDRFRCRPAHLVLTGSLELLADLKRLEPDVLVVLITSQVSGSGATETLRSGAYDHLTKPLEDVELISAVVQRAADRVRLIQDNRGLTERLRRTAGELEMLKQKLRSMATRDGLTGLYNHRQFRKTLDLELSRSERHDRRFALIFLDVDHFRLYNDRHGHLAGDQVLVEVGQLLLHDRRASTFVSRHGGDTFVVLLPETDAPGALCLAEAIRTRVAQHEFRGGDTQPLGKVTLSAGLAIFPEDGSAAGPLIDAADKALQAAKDAGRNAVVCRDHVPTASG